MVGRRRSTATAACPPGARSRRLDVLGDEAGGGAHRAADAHHLLDRPRRQVGSLASSAHWSGCSANSAHRQAELVAGGVVAGEQQAGDQRPQLVVRQPVAGLLGLDQRGDHVVPRLRGAGRRSARRRSRPSARRPTRTSSRWSASSKESAHVIALFQLAKSSWSSSGTPSTWHITWIG